MAPTVANPLGATFRDLPPSALSERAYTIAGIPCTVYGLTELSPSDTDVAVLWLLHPRLATHECMAPLAAAALAHWGRTREARRAAGEQSPGLGCIAVAFDQRNHGERESRPLANEAWRAGNESHAQDMFSAYHGTALDVSQLITYLPSYIFPTNDHAIATHLALGVSLGGHAAWHCLLHEPRVRAAGITIGCPDYAALMADRARLSKRESWTGSTPLGKDFFGSTDFPQGLVQAVETYDPAGLLLGDVRGRTPEIFERDPSAAERRRLVPLLRGRLQGKRILNLSGQADKLVPYRCGEPFLRWLKRAVRPGGWFADGGVVLEDIVFDGVGHEMTLPMVDAAVRFVGEVLTETERGLGRARARSFSKL